MKTTINLSVPQEWEKHIRKLIKKTETFDCNLTPFQKFVRKPLRFGRVDFLIFGFIVALIVSAVWVELTRG